MRREILLELGHVHDHLLDLGVRELGDVAPMRKDGASMLSIQPKGREQVQNRYSEIGREE